MHVRTLSPFEGEVACGRRLRSLSGGEQQCWLGGRAMACHGESYAPD
jgi:hypothetical protein